MTTIQFDRSGGVTGSDIHLNLDLNSIPEEQSQPLQNLLFEANFFDIPENPARETTPDEFHYVITVNAGHTSHTVHTTDTTMPKTLLPLVKELTRLNAIEE